MSADGTQDGLHDQEQPAPTKTLVVTLEVEQLATLVRDVIRQELRAIEELRVDHASAEVEESEAVARDGLRIPTIGHVEALLTVADVAGALRVDRKTIYRFVHADEGFPRPLRVGGTWRWKPDEFRNWLEHRERAG